MASRMIARFLIFIGHYAVALCNYWFTFGLWPQSWVSFFVCATAALALVTMSMALNEEK
jgi:hypothetical protein